MMLLVHLFVFDTNQATKIRQSILGDNHPVTISSLDFFTKVYAEAGADQYQGITDRQTDKMIKCQLIYIHFFMLFCVPLDLLLTSELKYHQCQ